MGDDGTAPEGEVRELLDAVIGVGEGLDLPEVLRRIVSTACAVTGARYAALGVREAGGGVGEFYSHGMDDAERALLGGTAPHGRGVPGLLLREDAAPLRLDDLTAHPASVGWPDGHPAMTTFLGVPIRVGALLFGTLYVADRADGRPFSAADAAALAALASAAGVAVGNARLYAAARRRQTWWEAASEAVHAVLDAQEGDDGLAAVARIAAEAAGADLVAVHLDDLGALRRAAAHGTGAADLPRDRDDDGGSDRWLPHGHRLDGGLQVSVPMVLGGHRIGALGLAWAPGPVPDEEDLVLVRTFAERVALAVEASRAAADRAALALLRDRDRIARDLHDLVIQRLFAIGLSLQAAGNVARVPEVATRLARAVDDLDDTIKDVRRTIFQLHGTAVRSPLRDELEELVAACRADVGVPVRLDVEGPILAVPDDVAPDVVAVVREGLSNVARHARASSAAVTLRIGRALELEVRDDGEGVSSDRRSGLANLEGRAVARGGSMRLESAPDAGTRLVWRVPRR